MPVIPDTQKTIYTKTAVPAQPGQKARKYLKITKAKKSCGNHLPSKCKALSSNTILPEKKIKKAK
jgi:hypothetical protein